MPAWSIAFLISSSSAPAVLVLAEFPLDGRKLFAQHVLALAIVDLLLRLLADLLGEFQHLEAMGDEPGESRKPFLDVDLLEDRLFLVGLDVEEPRDQVREQGRRFDSAQHRIQFRRCLRQELDRFGRLLAEHGDQRLDLRALALDVAHDVITRGEKRQARHEVERAEALLALADQMMHAAPGLDVPHDGHERADLVQVVGTRLVHRRILLQQEPELAPVLRRFLRRTYRDVAAEADLRHRAGEDHDIAHRQYDDEVVGQIGFALGGLVRRGDVFLGGVFFGHWREMVALAQNSISA